MIGIRLSALFDSPRVLQYTNTHQPLHQTTQPLSQYTQQISNPLTHQRPAHAFIYEPAFLRGGHTRVLTLTYPLSLWHSTSPFTRAHTQRGGWGGVQEVLGFSPPNANEKTQILWTRWYFFLSLPSAKISLHNQLITSTGNFVKWNRKSINS